MKEKSLEIIAPPKALLYCRVSSPKQKEEGHGLESQEHRCRQYAEMRGYVVEKVFPDDITGKGDFMKRPGMVALLKYLETHRRERYVVIFDDLKRFARDREFHFKLRGALAARRAAVECLNFRFDDTPEGEFVEAVFAAQGQLERQQNQRQVIQKMKARVERGYYVFAPVVGYRYEEVIGHGKMLVRDEPAAAIIQEGLESFAAGRLESAAEFKRWLEGFAQFPRSGSGRIGLQHAINILRRPLYAGYFSVEGWGVNFQKGQHEALVTLETWKKVQDRLDGRTNAPFRKDLSEDFALRGSVACTCGHLMTAGWSKGRNAQYGYYFCQNKACPENRKSIRKEKIEGEFAAMIETLQPAPPLFAAARQMLTKIWDAYRAAAHERMDGARAELAALERKGAQLIERVMKADNPALITAYEKEIVKLEESKALLAERSQSTGQSLPPFDAVYRTACAFLANPCVLWDSGVLAHRKTFLRLVFPARLEYCRNSGYRTTGIALPFKLFGQLSLPGSKVVEGAGFEPA